MIDGKLEEMGRDPRNVQVIVASDPRGRETLSLRDVDGEFVRVGAVEEQEGVATGGGDREESESTTSEQSIPHSAGELDDLRERNATLSTCNADLAAKVSSLNEEVKKVSDKLKREAESMSEMWRMNCAQVTGFDEAITAKDSEIVRLKARISELEARRPTSPAFLPASSPVRSVEPTHPPHSSHASVPTRRGKAPPVNEFSGDDPECLLEDWLPSLERASLWNAWSEEEKMIQLAGHLKGRALQEWNLLRSDQRSTFSQATEALRSRLDSASKSVAAQDFRHMTQREDESVNDFIRRLERTFRAAYGRDPMSLETRETLLHGQLQDGLRLQLLRGPAVSGGRTYSELCLAAKNEEKRLIDLKKRQEYSKLHSDSTASNQRKQGKSRQSANSSGTHPPKGSTSSAEDASKSNLRCFYCDKPGHRKEDCRKRKRDLANNSESRGPSKPPSAKKITTKKGSTNDSC